jgi:hypothetical protein
MISYKRGNLLQAVKALEVRKTHLLLRRFYTKNDPFYQDRPGTNKQTWGKTQPKTR